MMSKMEKITVPQSLERAIIKIRADLELDWDSACEHLAALADPNGEKFEKAVNGEANRRYKSRYLVELNKAKKSFIDDGFSKGRILGYKEGIEEGIKKWRISYPCSVCGKPLTMTPGGPDTERAVELLVSQNWKHSTCRRR